MSKSIPTPAEIPAAKTSDKQSEAVQASHDAPVASSQEEKAVSDSGVDYEAEAKKWKHFSRVNERRVKELEEKARAYDELKEAEKTEMERTLDKLRSAEARAKELEADSLRFRVGAKMGVDPEFLHGESEEELTEFAEKLLAWRGADLEESKPQTPPAASPVSDAGKRGDPVKVEQLAVSDLQKMDPLDIYKAYKKGNFARILAHDS